MRLHPRVKRGQTKASKLGTRGELPASEGFSLTAFINVSFIRAFESNQKGL